MLKDHPNVLSGSQIGSIVLFTQSQIVTIGAPSAFHRMEQELKKSTVRYMFGQVNNEIARGEAYQTKWQRIADRIIAGARLISGHPFD